MKGKKTGGRSKVTPNQSTRENRAVAQVSTEELKAELTELLAKF